MILRRGAVFSFVLATMALAVATRSSADLDQLEHSFERPPDDARIMMRTYRVKIDFASIACTPFVPSTSCVTCRSAAIEQST